MHAKSDRQYIQQHRYFNVVAVQPIFRAKVQLPLLDTATRTKRLLKCHICRIWPISGLAEICKTHYIQMKVPYCVQFSDYCNKKVKSKLKAHGDRVEVKLVTKSSKKMLSFGKFLLVSANAHHASIQ